jgi:hypothetical protein
MLESHPANDPTSPGPAAPAARLAPHARRRRIGLLAGLTLLAAGALAWLWFELTARPPDPGPLDGKLFIVVRPPDHGVEAQPVEEPGAVPVRQGGIMSLQVELNQPAFAYLVWLDSDGKAVPLYPWNHDTLQVRDVNEPPPARKAATVIYNPPIGGGWKFGPTAGLETVLLLVRRTHLEPGARLGDVLRAVPPPGLRHRNEVAVFGLGPGADSVTTLLALHRGLDAEARAADEPLRAAMFRLRDHFELIQAVRFAHEDKLRGPEGR